MTKGQKEKGKKEVLVGSFFREITVWKTGKHGGSTVVNGMTAAIVLMTVCAVNVFAMGEATEASTIDVKPASQREVRPAVFAGQWYPFGKEKLERLVDGYLNGAKGLPKAEGRLIGIVSPHAGFVYSGPVAAYGYRLLKESGQKIKTVIIIGPSHRSPLSCVSVNNVQDYRTPLGVLANDKQLAEQIIRASNGKFRYVPRAHEREHSLESQLPFLQRSLKTGCKIVPVLLNDASQAEQLASILTKLLSDRDDVIIIASSDMSHFRPYDEAQRIDEASFKVLERLDIAALEKGLVSGTIELCGGAAVLTLAKVAKGLGAKAMVGLKLANSGDTAGGKDAVVGYCSLAVSIPSGKMKVNDRSTGMDEQLSDAEKQQLLAIARDTIVEYVRHRRVPKVEVDSKRLKMQRGAFVTIKRHGSLRGCIGRFSPVSEPLYKIVQQMAVAAATQDPRFPPMSLSETSDMDIEISVLSDLSKIDSIDEIEVGVHGLEIEQGPFRGVLLPQVATENGWDKITFLEQTCRKAGLPKDAYKKGATIYVFSAQVFGEKD